MEAANLRCMLVHVLYLCRRSSSSRSPRVRFLKEFFNNMKLQQGATSRFKSFVLVMFSQFTCISKSLPLNRSLGRGPCIGLCSGHRGDFLFSNQIPDISKHNKHLGRKKQFNDQTNTLRLLVRLRPCRMDQWQLLPLRALRPLRLLTAKLRFLMPNLRMQLWSMLKRLSLMLPQLYCDVWDLNSFGSSD